VAACEDVLAGRVSLQLVLVPGDPDFAPVQDVTAPQLLLSVTVPPLAGSEFVLALTLHAEVVPLPEQLMVMFPLLSTLGFWQLAPLTVNVQAREGTGATRHADETAAASTRLTDLNFCMVLPRKNGGDVPPRRDAIITPMCR